MKFNHEDSGIQSYQGHIEGLRGWNDAPTAKASELEKAKQILNSVKSPQGLVVATLTKSMDRMKNSIQVLFCYKFRKTQRI